MGYNPKEAAASENGHQERGLLDNKDMKSLQQEEESSPLRVKLGLCWCIQYLLC